MDGWIDGWTLRVTGAWMTCKISAYYNIRTWFYFLLSLLYTFAVFSSDIPVTTVAVCQHVFH